MTSRQFDAQVTVIPGDWANDVDALVYDVFHGAQTAVAARAALGLGSMSLQEASAVAIAGGTVNSTLIGLVSPAAGHFSELRSTNGNPTEPEDVVTRGYLDNRFSGFSALASMLPSAIDFSGGTMNSVAIEGGSVDGAPIGSVNPSTGRFTSLSLLNPLSVAQGGTGASSLLGKYLTVVQTPEPHFVSVLKIPAADVQGLGTMATQAANSVAITGGTVDGVNFGNDNVFSGFGTLAKQNANAVNIVGGTLSGVTLIGIAVESAIQRISGATTADPTKDIFIVDGSTSYIVDLPPPSAVKKPLWFKKVGTARIDLRAPVGVTVDGDSVYNLFSDNESVTLVADGSKFYAF